MIGIVHDKLVELLGGSPEDSAKLMEALQGAAEDAKAGHPQPLQIPVEPPIMRISPGPTIVMMCGLQGSGKTTTCGKLAAYLKKRGRSVMLAPAALRVETELPGGAKVSFYAEPDKVAAYGKAVGVAVQVCKRALEAARKAGVDTLILDTAG